MDKKYHIFDQDDGNKSKDPVIDRLAKAVREVADKHGLAVFLVAMRKKETDNPTVSDVASTMMATGMDEVTGNVVADMVISGFGPLRECFAEKLRDKDTYCAINSERTVH